MIEEHGKKGTSNKPRPLIPEVDSRTWSNWGLPTRLCPDMQEKAFFPLVYSGKFAAGKKVPTFRRATAVIYLGKINPVRFKFLHRSNPAPGRRKQINHSREKEWPGHRSWVHLPHRPFFALPSLSFVIHPFGQKPALTSAWYICVSTQLRICESVHTFTWFISPS